MGQLTQRIGPFIPETIKLALRETIFKFKEKGFKPYVKKKNLEGAIFDFWIGDSTGRKWYESQWVHYEMRFIRDYLIQPGDVVFDCGAHHGFRTLAFAHWVGDKGKVVAFEPVPRNADIIQKNIELNHIQNVILERKAVGSREGKTVIADLSNSQVVNRKGNRIEVDLTYLDKYSHLNPTFLKIDVEGFEVEVLKGAKNILKRRPKLAIEIHPSALKKFNSSVKDVFQLIDAGKYKIWVQWGDGSEPKRYDGRIITKKVNICALPEV